MQSTTVEQEILEKVRSLSPEKQQAILDFTEFLVQKSQSASAEPSLAEFYSCIQDETFIRHPQGFRSEREPGDLKHSFPELVSLSMPNKENPH